MAAIGIGGWLLALWLAIAAARLRTRLELVARAEHELRGPLTAFSLALDAARRTAGGRRLATVLESELARIRAGLADLSAARAGKRAAPIREPLSVERLVRSSAAAWEPAARAEGRRVLVRSTAGLAVVSGDRSRFAQALGNVMANAVEHGAGDISVRATSNLDRVTIEVSNDVRAAAPDQSGHPRGRGMVIAADAVADTGGTLTAAVGSRRATAVLDLPLEQ
jgi:signal transduction histidine kinase